MHQCHQCRLPSTFMRRVGTVWCCPVLNCGKLFRIVIVNSIADSWKDWAEVPVKCGDGPH